MPNVIIDALCTKIMSISSVTDADYIEIVSTFMVATNHNFNCSMCKAKYPRQPEKREAMFEQKSCKKLAPKTRFSYKPKHSMAGNLTVGYSTCPANLFNSGTLSLINMVNDYDKGVLPYSGGVFEQPAKFVEVMELVHNLKEEYNQEQEKKLSKYGKRSKH